MNSSPKTAVITHNISSVQNADFGSESQLSKSHDPEVSECLSIITELY